MFVYFSGTVFQFTFATFFVDFDDVSVVCHPYFCYRLFSLSVVWSLFLLQATLGPSCKRYKADFPGEARNEWVFFKAIIVFTSLLPSWHTSGHVFTVSKTKGFCMKCITMFTKLNHRSAIRTVPHLSLSVFVVVILFATSSI